MRSASGGPWIALEAARVGRDRHRDPGCRGTLVDTNYQHALAWYMALREHDVGVPIWQGPSLSGWAETSSSPRSPVTTSRNGAPTRCALPTIQTLNAFAGARELIQALHDDGHAVVLACSAKERELDHYLDGLDARDPRRRLDDRGRRRTDEAASGPRPGG